MVRGVKPGIVRTACTRTKCRSPPSGYLYMRHSHINRCHTNLQCTVKESHLQLESPALTDSDKPTLTIMLSVTWLKNNLQDSLDDRDY